MVLCPLPLHGRYQPSPPSGLGSGGCTVREGPWGTRLGSALARPLLPLSQTFISAAPAAPGGAVGCSAGTPTCQHFNPASAPAPDTPNVSTNSTPTPQTVSTPVPQQHRSTPTLPEPRTASTLAPQSTPAPRTASAIPNPARTPAGEHPAPRYCSSSCTSAPQRCQHRGTPNSRCQHPDPASTPVPQRCLCHCIPQPSPALATAVHPVPRLGHPRVPSRVLSDPQRPRSPRRPSTPHGPL